jgi:hypothetical protein
MALTKVRTGGVADNAITATQLPTDFSNGITFYETMRLTTSVSTSGGDINGTFESTDTGNPAKKLISSTGMSASSGIFTFPATGMYLLMGRMRFYADLDLTYASMTIRTSTDNFSSNDVEATEGYATWGKHEGSNNYEMIAVDYVFDCENTSTHKFKMRAGGTSTINLGYSTDINSTYVTVVRLGDT